VHHQIGADALWVLGDWILKTEDALRIDAESTRREYAWTVGLERGLAGFMGLPWDVTWYLEYLHDTRYASLVRPFTNDVFTGLRLALNDVRASQATVSFIQDTELGEPAVLTGEVSARPYDRLKLELGGAWVIRASGESPLAPLAQDSHVRARISVYY
jgi:hypothetical protein